MENVQHGALVLMLMSLSFAHQLVKRTLQQHHVKYMRRY